MVVASESSTGSTSASSLSSGSPHSSPSPDTTYTKYAEKLADDLQLQEQNQGVEAWEGVDQEPTVESSRGEGPSAHLEEVDIGGPNGEVETVPTTSHGLEMFTSRINLVGDWAMSRLSLTSSSSYSSTSSISSVTPSESESSAGTVMNFQIRNTEPEVVQESVYDNQDNLTSAFSDSDSTIQTRIPWREKGKEKATDAKPSDVAQVASAAPPRVQKPVKEKRRISRIIVSKRRAIPIYHEPGFSRDFLLIVALCIGFACAIILIVRPAILRISGQRLDDFDFYGE